MAIPLVQGAMRGVGGVGVGAIPLVQGAIREVEGESVPLVLGVQKEK